MKLRNIAIIAHVDHGKTSLIDVLLKQSGVYRDNEAVSERAMDSNDIERERGITILAKCTSVEWKDVRINIIDTPGHADFGGEVERILSMVDGVIVLVDAAEGPMPQTKFVVSKALKLGLRPIVAVNKIDKPEERHEEVIDEVFDLFSNLDADEQQLDFPMLYGSAKQGWMALEPEGPKENMHALFDLVLDHVPEPTIEEGPFRMLAVTVESDPFLGRILTGRIASGKAVPNAPIHAIGVDGTILERGKISKILAFRGLQRTPIDEAEAGDIVAIAGMSQATVADTLADTSVKEPIDAQPIDPPTISMTFRINDGPFAGQEGSKVQSRIIRNRLMSEAEGNVALKIKETEDNDALEVSGRGELQLAVLIENMRREGFELTVSRPRVVYQYDENGNRLEPIEEATIDVDEEYSGTVVKKMAERKGELIDMRESGVGRQRIMFHVPSRGLIGYLSELMTDTKGTAILNRIFHSYAPHKGKITGRRTGVLLSNGQGEAVAFALWKLEDRGPMMVSPQTKVYEGMIIGQHTRENDLVVNCLKGKQLTNMRASGKDDAVALTTPKILTLEEALAYINDDELVEVTPENIRLRKVHLSENDRKKAERANVDS